MEYTLDPDSMYSVRDRLRTSSPETPSSHRSLPRSNPCHFPCISTICAPLCSCSHTCAYPSIAECHSLLYNQYTRETNEQYTRGTNERINVRVNSFYIFFCPNCFTLRLPARQVQSYSDVLPCQGKIELAGQAMHVYV